MQKKTRLLNEEFRWKLRTFKSIFTSYLSRFNYDGVHQNDRGLCKAGVFRSHDAYHYDDDEVYFPDKTIALSCFQDDYGLVIW